MRQAAGGAIPPRFVVAPIQALLAAGADGRGAGADVADGAVSATSLPVEELTAWLVERGMTRAEVVEVAGEFSLRGGILDVFPPDASDPVRIEFFGDEVESIRPFDAETQRSLDRWDSRRRSTAAVASMATTLASFGHAADAFPEGTWVALVEPNDLREEGRHYLGRVDDPRGSVHGRKRRFERLIKYPSITLSTLAADSLEATCHLRIESVERFSGELTKVKAELDSGLGRRPRPDRLPQRGRGRAAGRGLRRHRDWPSRAGSHLTVGRIRSGFHLIDARTLVIGDHELFARADIRRPTTRRRYESRAIDSFLDLNEGDLVVHVNHGIARYRGLQFVDKSADHAEETLLLEFAEGTKLYVPIAKIDLVQKYVGGGKAEPALSKIGSSSLGEAEEARGRGGGRPGQRADRHPGRAREPAGDRLPGRGQPLDGRVRGRVPLPGDARPALRDRGRQARHGPDPSRWTA